jgi:hypothetical protein
MNSSLKWIYDRGVWMQQTQTTHRAVHMRCPGSWVWIVRRGTDEGEPIGAGEASSLDEAKRTASRIGVTVHLD